MRIVVVVLLLASVGAEEPRAPVPPPLDRVVEVFAQPDGEVVALPALLDALAGREAVFLGETHLDETTHRLELALLEGLLARTEGKVVLALEMFERDVQPALDDYLAGRTDEEAFLARARPWANYRTGYRPLVEAAKRAGIPVVASNAPVSLRHKVARGKAEAFANLTEDERPLLPAELHPNPDRYWERFERVVRGHMGFVAGSTPEARLYSTQSLWDNTMGDSVARALARRPGHLVLHVNGGFHSQYREGAVHQLLQRRPGTRVAVVEIVTTTDLPAADRWRAPERADFLAAVDARARGPSEGFHAVTVAPELRYRLHVPAGGRDLPLLVWLGEDGLRAADVGGLWKAALGDDAALAVIEPPYPQREDDLAQGGRWFWAETFSEDLGVLQAGVERVVAYLLRHYPIDAERVAVGGTGAGGTVAAAVALYSGALHVPFLAVRPERYAGLRNLALPYRADPEAPRGTLAVLAGDAAWWTEEAAAHAKAGLDTTVAPAPAAFDAVEARVRTALGLAPRETADAARLFVRFTDTPRARFWAERMAVRAGARVVAAGALPAFLAASPGPWTVQPLACLGEEAPLPEGVEAAPPFSPAEMKEGHGLPLAAGPFGGTTILLVPEACPPETRAAWEELEAEGALSKRTRFARLVVVDPGGLAGALQAVQDAGRSTVLVVPAVFCADAESMRRWAQPVRAFEDVLNLSWLPGLGGELDAVHERRKP